MPRNLIRVLVGLGIAIGLVAGLAWFLTETSEPSTAAADVVPVGPRMPRSMPIGRPILLYLAAPDRALPERVAPVVEITLSGDVHVRRGAPMPDEPGPDGQTWLAAGIVVPRHRLADLDAVQRAALLRVAGLWVGPGGGRLVDAVEWGLESDAAELARLDRWLR